VRRTAAIEVLSYRGKYLKTMGALVDHPLTGSELAEVTSGRKVPSALVVSPSAKLGKGSSNHLLRQFDWSKYTSGGHAKNG
jgi:hypothetical protein